MGKWTLFGALLLVFACEGNGTVGTNNANNQNNDNNANNENNRLDANNANNRVDTGPGTDQGPDLVVAPFGLDARPSNTTCLAVDRPPPSSDITVDRVFPNLSLSNIVWLQQAPGVNDTWYVVEKGGFIRSFVDQNDTAVTNVFLDVSDRVEDNGEAGLLGMAFHPDWQNNNELYISYVGTRPVGGGLESRLSRVTIVGGTADASTEEILLRVDQPANNHNGGALAFGPDGYLYLSIGDGGPQGDPAGVAQNPNELLGTFVRIDIDSAPQGNLAYAIPSDNPFINGGGRAEVYAYGFRNPWRFSFDIVSGTLWVGDVGQDEIEEISIVERGGNYGWNLKEGFSCFDVDPCDNLPVIDPVVDYPHSLGVSVTGGYVYRGTDIPSLNGTYIFGDFVTNRIWSVVYDPITGEPSRNELLQAGGLSISAFGQANDGEVYVLAYNGRIFKVNEANPQPNNFPQTLSATGCVDAVDPLLPASGLVPYRLNAPFWSDGATKRRYMALPDGETLDVDGDGDIIFPIGSVLVKDFTVNGQRVETRLMMRHTDGGWAGYSYEWNDGQTDATLLPSDKVRDLGNDQSWNYPSRADCMRCHTQEANTTLGPELSQLNGLLTYESTGRLSNQIETLRNIEIFTIDPGAATSLAVMPDPFGTEPENDRARAYLHTNCSSCHRPDAPLRVDFDFTYNAPLDSFCNVDVINDLGVGGALVIVPGDPDSSVALLRASSRDANGMPPIGSLVVDDPGTQLLRSWIGSLQCP